MTMSESVKNSSSNRNLLFCVLFLLSTELAGFWYLHAYIAAVEKRCVDDQPQPTQSSRKRRAATLEDNAVTTADDTNVEFINPKLRSEIDGRNGGTAEGESASNPWVWLTSYSRIPVS